MDFDNDDGTLYAFTYQGGGTNQYGTIDLGSGTLTPLSVDNPLGEFEGATQTVCAAPAVPIIEVPTVNRAGVVALLALLAVVGLIAVRRLS